MSSGTERPESAILRRAMRGHRFSCVRWVDETGSTNDDLLRAATDGAPEQVLLADLQTAGRGRRNRVWTAPPGTSVLMSILMHDRPAGDAFWSVGAVALAAAQGVEAVAGVPCSLKWPNDLLIGEAKVAGVLAEVVADSVVVGIGINVNWPRLPMIEQIGGIESETDSLTAAGVTALEPTAVSHHRAGNEPTDRVALVVDILERAAGWLAADSDTLRSAWHARCATIGREVRLEVADGVVLGRAIDVAANGALIIEHAGRRADYQAGDVIHVRTPA